MTTDEPIVVRVQGIWSFEDADHVRHVVAYQATHGDIRTFYTCCGKELPATHAIKRHEVGDRICNVCLNELRGHSNVQGHRRGISMHLEAKRRR